MANRTLTITHRINGPTEITGDLDQLPEIGRARRSVRARFVPVAYVDELSLTGCRLVGFIQPRHTRRGPVPKRRWVVLTHALLMASQPQPLRRGPKVRRGRRLAESRARRASRTATTTRED